MPVITAAGEPGPSCSGNAGRPRSRVMVMYYDARNGGVGLTAGGTGYVAGGRPPVRRADRRGQRLQQGRAGTARLRRVAADVALQSQLHAAARHRPDARLRLHRRQPRLQHLLRRVLRVLGRLHSSRPAAALRADANGLEADHRQRRRSEHAAGARRPGFLGRHAQRHSADEPGAATACPTSPASSTACRSGTTSHRERASRRPPASTPARAIRTSTAPNIRQGISLRARRSPSGRTTFLTPTRCSWRIAPACSGSSVSRSARRRRRSTTAASIARCRRRLRPTSKPTSPSVRTRA